MHEKCDDTFQQYLAKLSSTAKKGNSKICVNIKKNSNAGKNNKLTRRKIK